MYKFKILILVLILVGCAQSDDTPDETFFDPVSQNSAEINFGGVQIPNDSIQSIIVNTSFCCEKDIRIHLSLRQPEFRGHILTLKLSSDGQILRYHTQNDFLDPSTDFHFNPVFYIPEEFFELEYFEFDFEKEKLELKAELILIKEGTYFEDGKVIQANVEVDVNYFSTCSCGTENGMMRKVELNSEINFSNFSMSTTGFNPNRIYAYKSDDVSSGYYFELGNLSAKLKDYPLGTYSLDGNDSTPTLIFKKFDGPPHAYLTNMFIEGEWIDYEIQGQFEILEKLENGQTRSNLSFTAFQEGVVVFEFTDIEMIL